MFYTLLLLPWPWGLWLEFTEMGVSLMQAHVLAKISRLTFPLRFRTPVAFPWQRWSAADLGTSEDVGHSGISPTFHKELFPGAKRWGWIETQMLWLLLKQKSLFVSVNFPFPVGWKAHKPIKQFFLCCFGYWHRQGEHHILLVACPGDQTREDHSGTTSGPPKTHSGVHTGYRSVRHCRGPIAHSTRSAACHRQYYVPPPCPFVLKDRRD